MLNSLFRFPRSSGKSNPRRSEKARVFAANCMKVIEVGYNSKHIQFSRLRVKKKFHGVARIFYLPFVPI